MTTFTVGRPVTTREPSIAVDAGLKSGRHRFQLEVIDNSGNRSRPAQAIVVINERGATGGGTTRAGATPGPTRPRQLGAQAAPAAKRRKPSRPASG